MSLRYTAARGTRAVEISDDFAAFEIKPEEFDAAWSANTRG
ncbi:MAG: hypothetical protein JWO86_9196 [Myxococcaceae bacterium]|nr:hypothetical protein [Myxococcaceae bacterium]